MNVFNNSTGSIFSKMILCAALLSAVACASRDSSAKHPSEKEFVVNPWTSAYEPPLELDTPLMHLEPLGPLHTERDFAAFMSCREFIAESLHWGSWPSADMTLAKNRRDLEMHQDNFNKRTQFTYTVLTPSRDRAVGCIYMDPVYVNNRRGGPGERKITNPLHMELLWWVSKSELSRDLDWHLVASVLEWVRRDFPFTKVQIPVYKDYKRGADIMRYLSLRRSKTTADGYDIYVWER